MARANAKENNKDNKKGGLFYRIIIILLLAVMAFSGYNLYKIYSEYHAGTVIYDDLADEVGAKKSGTDNSRLHLDWDKLKEKNPDIIAWIRCRDTVINYPVVQGTDNDYYLYRTVTGEYNGKGTIFVDAGCENPFNDFMTIMYGHRMKDNSMFGTLKHYFGSGGKEYWTEHPIIELYTPEQDYDIHLFAGAVIDGTDMEWYRLSFKDAYGVEDPEWTSSYLNRVRSGNQLYDIEGEVPVSSEDKIVMLSTCTAQVDNNRQVMWGKLVKVED